ncbi:hypothetical protein NDU88_004960 [Pleurodeles waltl]|uniref:Uncharacterized protein n=1 Tax=Pleurodeles waltl TaxID=8319 RepID=A0AAV7W9C1_PLEWA|nr:hypothetical protein NDU88_004960 [Pleurodeles waltl]
MTVSQLCNKVEKTAAATPHLHASSAVRSVDSGQDSGAEEDRSHLQSSSVRFPHRSPLSPGRGGQQPWRTSSKGPYTPNARLWPPPQARPMPPLLDQTLCSAERRQAGKRPGQEGTPEQPGHRTRGTRVSSQCRGKAAPPSCFPFCWPFLSIGPPQTACVALSPLTPGGTTPRYVRGL